MERALLTHFPGFLIPWIGGVYMSYRKAALLFIGFTAYFYLLLFTLLPFVKASFTVNPALYWFITGYFLFVPLFVTALLLSAREGHSQLAGIRDALNLRPLSKTDWGWAIGGLLLVFLASGLIFGIFTLLNRWYGMPLLNTTPWFMEMHPFKGADRWLLLVWLPMFFFNIAGEELLWRGYVQSRLSGRYSWVLCSILWLLFHLPFGRDLMILLVPVIIIIPYAFHKTRNTTVGIFIHGVYNGPMFVAVALGLLQ